MNQDQIVYRAAVDEILRFKMEKSLALFFRNAWPSFDPDTYTHGYHIDAIAEHLEAVTNGQIRKLLINIPPRHSKSNLVSIAWPAWTWTRHEIGPLSGPQVRFLCLSYSLDLSLQHATTARRLIESKWYRKYWGKWVKVASDRDAKAHFDTTAGGARVSSSFGGSTLGRGGDIKIIDDPHKVDEVESALIRESVIREYDETLKSRVTDPRTSAEVIIMQRLGEDDLSGHVLDEKTGGDHVHLMLPAEFDSARNCVTVIGGDWRTEDGDLLWPERFGPKELEPHKKLPHVWCNPGEAPILMGDLSLKRIDEVKVGDEVIGFDIGTGDKRARLKPSKVLSISKSFQPVVRMLLDSEHIIRCTPDHKWFTGRNEFARKQYASARVGSKLRRICPPELPKLETEEEFRLAGWLSGFFDGEGSVSLLNKRGFYGNSLITFFQSAEQNLPLCEKLEYSLSRFGFNFGCKEKQPTTLSSAGVPWQKRRNYYLKSDAGKGVTFNGNPAKRGGRLQLNQRFLHLIKPTKWRKRIIDSTANGRMWTTSERVLSIRPDGQDLVYGLETTTGNYVVWGLASSNSGQYQQSPEPRGGAIIKRDYWQLWQEDKYPNFEFILASLDTAFTAKEENDASALTIWGVFREDKIINDLEAETTGLLWMKRDGQVVRPPEGNPKIMLLWAWEDRMEFHELLQWVIETCVPSPAPISHPRFPVDKLLIEAKANGLSVGHEMHRMFGGSGRLGIELIDPRRYGDKIARVHGIEHLFADKMIYAPDKSWADMVINQCAVFPRGAHDDLVDSTTQALRYLREVGFALKRDEYSVVAEEELMYKSQSSMRPLYEV